MPLKVFVGRSDVVKVPGGAWRREMLWHKPPEDHLGSPWVHSSPLGISGMGEGGSVRLRGGAMAFWGVGKGFGGLVAGA